MKKLALFAFCALALVAFAGVTVGHASSNASSTVNIYDPEPEL